VHLRAECVHPVLAIDRGDDHGAATLDVEFVTHRPDRP
jgi:hypothetical protein